MTIEEVRNHEEYFQAMNKIERYPKGFEFTLLDELSKYCEERIIEEL